jgi:sporulation-control protein
VFEKWLASLGIGSAKVDTQLNQEDFFPGDQVDGQIVIRGGDSVQQIEDIYLELIVEYLKDGKNVRHTYQQYYLAEKIIVSPGEEKTIPLTLQLPIDLPMSTGQFPIYLQTGLDIKFAKDPSDRDRINILPLPLIQKVLKDIEDAGFILYRIMNSPTSKKKSRPFEQIFEFKPTGRYQGILDKLHGKFEYNDDHVLIVFNLYRSGDIISYSFTWEHQNPSGTLLINNQPCEEDPLSKIQELLIRRK